MLTPEFTIAAIDAIFEAGIGTGIEIESDSRLNSKKEQCIVKSLTPVFASSGIERDLPCQALTTIMNTRN